MLRNGRVRCTLVAALASVALLTETLLSAPMAAAQGAPDQGGQSLLVQADFVLGVANLAPADMPLKACVQTSRFPRNSDIVFRARVWDPATGAPMDEQSMSAVEINLTDGTTIAMRYGPHPANGPATDMFWSGAWVVPKDYPPGTLDYSIVARAVDQRTGEFQPFNVMPSLLTITSEVTPGVAP
jgi:hypothetical protein